MPPKADDESVFAMFDMTGPSVCESTNFAAMI
jgi:hypothetical protein